MIRIDQIFSSRRPIVTAQLSWSADQQHAHMLLLVYFFLATKEGDIVCTPFLVCVCCHKRPCYLSKQQAVSTDTVLSVVGGTNGRQGIRLWAWSVDAVQFSLPVFLIVLFSPFFEREERKATWGYIPVHLFVHCITNKDLSVLHAQCYNNCTLPGACHVVANCGAYL